MLLNYIIWKNLEKFSLLLKKYKQNLELLDIAIYELNQEKLLIEDNIEKKKIENKKIRRKKRKRKENERKEKERKRKMKEEKLRN